MWANCDLVIPKAADKIGKFFDDYLFFGEYFSFQSASYYPRQTAFSCAFDKALEGYQHVQPPIYGIFGIYQGGGVSLSLLSSSVSLHVSPIIAFVDTTGSGDPYDPGNQLYASILFTGRSLSDSGTVEVVITTKKGGTIGGTPIIANTIAPCSLKLKFSATDIITVPIYYAQEGLFYGGDYLPVTGTDFVIEAKEWWPYKTTDGSPAWSSTNGHTKNGGPGA